MKTFLEMCNGAFAKSEFSVCVTDTNLDLPGPVILYVNPVFEENTGWSPEEILGKTPRVLQGPNTDRSVLDRLKKDLLEGHSFEGHAFNYKKDGSEILVKWSIMRSSFLGQDYYIALQKICDPFHIINWLEKIKEVQLRIVELLEEV